MNDPYLPNDVTQNQLDDMIVEEYTCKSCGDPKPPLSLYEEDGELCDSCWIIAHPGFDDE